MFAVSVVSFVVCWLKQGGFPSQGEERQHRKPRCILHTWKRSTIWTWAVTLWAFLPVWAPPFLGLVRYRSTVQALHIGLPLTSWLPRRPVGLCRSARHLWWHCCAAAKQKEGNLHKMCAPELDGVGWGHHHATSVLSVLTSLGTALCQGEKGLLLSMENWSTE